MIDNENVLNKVLQCEFNFYCQRYFQKLVINGETMSEKQILLFNENYLGPITRVSGENEKLVSSFFNSMINLTRHTVDKESFQKGLL